MKPPRLVLPSGSMPWGRWAQEQTESTTRAITSEESNLDSNGAQFKSRAENLSKQIAGINNVSTIERRTIPNFTRTPSGSGPYYCASPTVTFNVPRPGNSYTFSAIFEFSASVGGNSNFNFPKYYATINSTGTTIWSQNGYDGIVKSINFSMMYTAVNVISSSATCQFIVSNQGLYDGSTVSFTNCSITGIFLGAL